MIIPGFIIAALWGAIGSFALLIGGFFGYKFNISKKIIAITAAFSSGMLISAVCFELLFKSYSYGDIYSTSIGFAIGVILFTTMDAIVHKFSIEKSKNKEILKEDFKNTRKTNKNDINNLNILKHRYNQYFNKYQIKGLTTVFGATLDGIPESIAIGLIYFIGGPISIVLLSTIFVANLFEGASASLNMKLGGWKAKEIFKIWTLVILLTTTSAMLSYIIFSHTDKHLLSAVLAMAAGGFIAMIADTLLPEAYDEMQELTGLIMGIGFLISFVLSHLTMY